MDEAPYQWVKTPHGWVLKRTGSLNGETLGEVYHHRKWQGDSGPYSCYVLGESRAARLFTLTEAMDYVVAWYEDLTAEKVERVLR